MRMLFAMLATLVLGACATNSASDAKVRDGEPARLNRDCKLLGTVTGRSLFGGMADNAKTEAAMANAREKAAAMGATDVYFLTVDSTGILNTTQATARAFACK